MASPEHRDASTTLSHKIRPLHVPSEWRFHVECEILDRTALPAMSRIGLDLEGCKVPDQRRADCPKLAKYGDAASEHVPEMFPFQLTGKACT